jgi:putative membrane protein
VRDFGNRMITDHTMANDMLMDVLQSISITPAENPISEELMAETAKEIKKLKKLSGSSFDREYMDAQVKDHMMVLDLIDSTLLPQVDDATLRQQLTSMRATVNTHLDLAKQIVQSLEADGGTQ